MCVGGMNFAPLPLRLMFFIVGSGSLLLALLLLVVVVFLYVFSCVKSLHAHQLSFEKF